MAEIVSSDGLNDRNDFVRLLAERFPAVAAEIDEFERGLLHLEMAVLARATCREIEADQWSEVRSHLDFVDELFSKAGPQLENAIYVSYLEDVFLGSSDPCYTLARAELSDRLQIALSELEAHWKKIDEWQAKQLDAYLDAHKDRS